MTNDNGNNGGGDGDDGDDDDGDADGVSERKLIINLISSILSRPKPYYSRKPSCLVTFLKYFFRNRLLFIPVINEYKVITCY